MSSNRFDVVVMGGGPAGSAAAALLAPNFEVLLIEREAFPRFHIGESLLPMALPILEEIGVKLEGEPFLFKQGAEFIDERTGEFAFYSFADGLPGAPKHAYQVERDRFDGALLAAAHAAGATVHTQERVEAVEFEQDAVHVRTQHGDYRARYVVDATGQDALLGRRSRTIERITGLGRAAAFAHYDLGEREFGELLPQGNVKVLRTQNGWLWVIPLYGGRASIGVVSRDGLKRESVFEAVGNSPMLRRLTTNAKVGTARTIADYSYRNRVSYGARFVAIGDAACFLDPVFSSGVTLALHGAKQMAECLTVALHEGREHSIDLMQGLSQHMERGYESFFAMIHRFYNGGVMENLFLGSDPEPVYRSGLITLLAGDVWRHDNPLQELLLRSERGPKWRS